ncbi:hypothetical protein GCM10022254_08580 [Actinomadura meridiana]|uniref:Uncharacterized protein n=1 Tax=Actinomadura meridiana TaxID=559626 RepID=A0ABP8BTN9_9ACTN
MTVRLVGELNLVALRRSIGQLIHRHEVLRTGFVAVDGRPVQRVAPKAPEGLTIEELEGDGLTAEQRDEAIHRWEREAVRQPFDLDAPPLLRTRLLRIENPLVTDHRDGLREDRRRTEKCDYLLVLVAHRLVIDLGSAGVLVEELAAGYAAAVRKRPPERGTLPFQYADFAAWQRDESFSRESSYWRNRLMGAPVGLALPPTRLPSRCDDAPKSLIRRWERGKLPQRLVTEVTTLAAQHEASLFTALFTAFTTLMARYSGHDDVVVGTTVAKVPHQDLKLIGPFTDVMPLRIDLASRPTFRQALTRVREELRSAQAHRDLPFDQLTRELWPQRHAGAYPTVQVTFDLAEFPPVELARAGLRLSAHTARYRDPRLPLAVHVAPGDPGGVGDAGLVLEAGYDDDLFSARYVADMLEQFRMLLIGIVQDPDAPVHDVPLTSPAHRRLLPDPTLPPRRRAHPLITELLRDSAARHHDLPMLEQGVRRWSYGDLSARAHALADTLRAAGHVPGGVIAVAARHKGFDLYAAIWAVWLARGTLLLVDTALPPSRRTYMINRAGARTIIAVGPESAEAAIGAPEAAVVHAAADTEAILVRTGTRPQRCSDGGAGVDDPAYVFFTSGTTGSPKALLGRHNGLSHFLMWQSRRFDIGPHDRCAPLLSLSADAVLRDIFTPLVSGACLSLPAEPAALAGDATLPLAWMREAKITMAHTVPSLASAALATPSGTGQLDQLRLLFFAGEPLSGRLAGRFRALAPHAAIVNLYGASECTMVQTCYSVPPSFAAGRVPAGRGITDVEAVVTTPGGTLCAPGEIGEVLIRSPYSSLGYLGHQETTGLLHNPFRDAPLRDDPVDLIFPTGDRGRFQPDGTLEILGRSADHKSGPAIGMGADQVNAILGTHSAVAASVVIAPDKLGFVAYVVFYEQRTASSDQLRRFLERSCPPEAIPVRFIPIDQIPVTTIGKLSRQDLPAPSP